MTADLVGAHPANRMVATSAVREAELRSGRIFPKLELTLSDGETLTWRWWAPANRSFEDVHDALRRMLGSRLQHSR